MNEEYRFIKKNGIFYTDKKLANRMVSLLKIDYKMDFTLVEPAVGEGHILSLIVKKYFIENQEKSVNEKIAFLEKNIAGFDVRKDAVEKCINKLNKISEKYINRELNWNIKTFDALNRKSLLEEFGTFDFVISNPPYVSRHNMDEKTIKALKENSYFCSKYNFDLYYYFFEIGFDLWNRAGKIVYITPNSYIKARSGEIMMEYLIDNSFIETIIDYKDEILFEGANTYTAITVFSGKNKFLKVKNSKRKNIVEVSYQDLIEKYNYKVYSHTFLTETQNNYISLGDIAEIRNGLATLQDKVFVINERELLDETDDLLSIKKNGKKFSVETPCIKKVIRVSNVKERKYVIFPYKISSNPRKIYERNLNIENQYPEVYKYLTEELSKTYQDNYGIYFGRTQGFTCYNDQKIVIPKVASLEDSAFKIVEKGFLLSGLSIKLKNDYLKTDLKQILDYLNSEVVRAYLTVTSKNYAAGYKSISSTDLKMIRIPCKYIIKEE